MAMGSAAAGLSVDAQVTLLLAGDGVAPLEALVGQLMSPGNEQRGQAEQLFNHCKANHPDALVVKMVHALQVSQQMEVRAMVAILLRKLITKDDVSLWPQLSPVTQTAVKGQLLLCVQREEGKSICKKLCDTVAELAAGILEEGMWPELLPFMFQCVSSDSMRQRESALLMFAQLAQYIGPQLRAYLPTLHTIFQQCLSADASSDVRIAALRATTNFVQTLETAVERESFQDLLPGMLQTLSLALNNGEEAAAQEALEMFIEVAGTEPRFLRCRLVEVVGNMLQIAEAEELEEGTRHLAVEFLITLAEARERAPGMMRKLPQFIGRLFVILMKMLLDIEDDPQWHFAESEEEDAGETADYEVGQECLDRLAISLGGNTVLPVAFQLLPSFVNDSDWKKRHAALIALAQIAEGCSKVLVGISCMRNLHTLCQLFLCYYLSPSPRKPVIATFCIWLLHLAILLLKEASTGFTGQSAFFILVFGGHTNLF